MFESLHLKYINFVKAHCKMLTDAVILSINTPSDPPPPKKKKHGIKKYKEQINNERKKRGIGMSLNLRQPAIC